MIAHFPSGEKSPAMPSPSGIGGDLACRARPRCRLGHPPLPARRTAACSRHVRYPPAATSRARKDPALGSPGGHGHHRGALFIPGQQNPAIGGDILQRNPTREHGTPDAGARRDLLHRYGAAVPLAWPKTIPRNRRETRPALPRFPSRRRELSFARNVNQRDHAPVIVVGRMIEERDLVALGRNSGMADPAIGFVQNMPDGIFKPLLAPHIANNGQSSSHPEPNPPRMTFSAIWRGDSPAQRDLAQGAAER